ncbi:hypothetical protein VTJ04DRAFT_10682 [Mycothermus thermophilus]|uniref:uncharacterized protein n=1 Tax=Humicola insolens TaxID=85995 RepID=UPI003742B717
MKKFGDLVGGKGTLFSSCGFFPTVLSFYRRRAGKVSLFSPSVSPSSQHRSFFLLPGRRPRFLPLRIRWEKRRPRKE